MIGIEKEKKIGRKINRKQTTGRSASGSKRRVVRWCALSFRVGNKRRVVWHLKRTVVRVRAKRRVVWFSVDALSSVCTRRPVVRSRDQTARRPSKADARSFGLTETTPFWHNWATTPPLFFFLSSLFLVSIFPAAHSLSRSSLSRRSPSRVSPFSSSAGEVPRGE